MNGQSQDKSTETQKAVDPDGQVDRKSDTTWIKQKLVKSLYIFKHSQLWYLLIDAQFSQRQDSESDADIIVTRLWLVYFATFHTRDGIHLFLIMLGF